MKHPPDLDIARLKSLMGRVHPTQDKPDALKDVLSALMGIEYRFSAFAAHDDAFTALISDPNNAGETRYLQERELFEFFVTGQSAVECAAFGAYRYASCVCPEKFTKEPKKVNLEATAKSFGDVYPTEALSGVLSGIADSSEWELWTDARNVLIHRAHPGRNFSNVGPTKWLGVEFGGSFTVQRRRWLAGVLGELLVGMDSFVHANYV